MGDFVESGEVGQGLGGLVEVAVDVGAGFVELGVVGEERVEGVEALEFEAGQRAHVAHGFDEGGAALDAVGMDTVFLGKRHVVVPLLAQAPVAGGRVVDILGQGMHVHDGVQIELGLPVAERVGVLAEGGGERANAVMDLVPCQEGVFEAGAVGFGVVGDRLRFGKEGLRALAPAPVGGEAGERELLFVGRRLQLLQPVEAGLYAFHVALHCRKRFGLAAVLVEDGGELLLQGRRGARRRRGCRLAVPVARSVSGGRERSRDGREPPRRGSRCPLPIEAELFDVRASLNEFAVVGEQGVEGSPADGLESVAVAQRLHGLDERGVAGEVVGMAASRFGAGDVCVPLVAQPAVAGIGLVALGAGSA